VVEGKHIPEQGTRQELLERNGIYAALERAQELSDVSENHE
jgi:ABC-type multidrug transport system fused ATPase/permease subunit